MVEATQKTKKTQSKENDLVVILRSNYLAIAEMVASGNVSEPRLKELSQQIASNPLSENIKQAEAAKFPGPIQQVIHQTLQGTNGTTGSTKDSGVNQVMIAQSVAETKQAVIAETQRQQTIEPLSQEEEKLVDNFLDETDSRKRTEMLRTLPAPVLLKVQRGIFKRSERATQRLLETDYPSEQAEKEACQQYKKKSAHRRKCMISLSDESWRRLQQNPDDEETRKTDAQLFQQWNNNNKRQLDKMPKGGSESEKTVRGEIALDCMVACAHAKKRDEKGSHKDAYTVAQQNLTQVYTEMPPEEALQCFVSGKQYMADCSPAFWNACRKNPALYDAVAKEMSGAPLLAPITKNIMPMFFDENSHTPPEQQTSLPTKKESNEQTPPTKEPCSTKFPSPPTLTDTRAESTPQPTCCATLSLVGSKVPEGKTDKDLNDHLSFTR